MHRVVGRACTLASTVLWRNKIHYRPTKTRESTPKEKAHLKTYQLAKNFWTLMWLYKPGYQLPCWKVKRYLLNSLSLSVPT